ncbi:MAG: 2-oxoacid:acceptor oxidoreductase family protein [Acidobacteriota bacterium]
MATRYAVHHRRPLGFYPEFLRKSGDPHTTHYCPGCGHGVIHKFIAEAIEDFGIQDRAILVSPVGCSVFAYYYLDVGNVQAAHGRAPAVATGIKRCRPESIVICYQGDGDLAAIGMAEIVHAANRGEAISVFFVNNAIYGMTGGQMAPTTLLTQKTVTTPVGRRAVAEGYPLRVCELLQSLEGASYLERCALTGPKTHLKARKAVRRALKNQIEGKGFSLVEILSPCPTGWKMKPEAALRWVEESMIPVFPLGVYKDSPGAPRERPSGREIDVTEVPANLDMKPAPRSAVTQEHTLPFEQLAIKTAGFGGQGVLSLGVILAIAGMRQGLEVSWLPSYGPEMRGGTAHCNVFLSHRQIGSPLVDAPDLLMCFNGPSLERFHQSVKPGGIVFYDSSLIGQRPSNLATEVIGVPATELAHDLGELKVANMVLLGAVLARMPVLGQIAVWHALTETMKSEHLRELNRKALQMGERYYLKEKSM